MRIPGYRCNALSLALAATTACFGAYAEAQQTNGFDLSNATVPLDEIRSGGPPRDGIPSIDQPKFVAASEVDYLKGSDLVFGLADGDERRAYPLRILVWHEIVNDTLGGEPVAITFCPLCGTAMAFERRIGEQTVSFGISGLLYQSDVLMYDRESESLWSQLAMKSVSGPQVGTQLNWLAGEQMTWDEWRSRHPDSEVLSTDTGFKRTYQRMPYQGYEDRPDTLFPVPHHRDELGNKDWVAGLVVGGKAAAVSLEALAKAEDHLATIEVGGAPVTVRYNPEKREVTARNTKGAAIPVVQVYWFAWQAFYPETLLWQG